MFCKKLCWQLYKNIQIKACLAKLKNYTKFYADTLKSYAAKYEEDLSSVGNTFINKSIANYKVVLALLHSEAKSNLQCDTAFKAASLSKQFIFLVTQDNGILKLDWLRQRNLTNFALYFQN